MILIPGILAFAVATKEPRMLSGVSRWLGFISYPLYALHFPVLLLVSTLLLHQPMPFALKLSAWLGTVTVCLALSWSSARWWDAPIRRLLSNVRRPAQSLSATRA
jgi:peptidoglycan/LPS O-acetylase OafA/YrhL